MHHTLMFCFVEAETDASRAARRVGRGADRVTFRALRRIDKAEVSLSIYEFSLRAGHGW
jgi:hypothetical protein